MAPSMLGNPAGRVAPRFRPLLRAGMAALKRVTPGRWFLIGFLALFLLFLVVLVLEPGAVGRGGR